MARNEPDSPALPSQAEEGKTPLPEETETTPPANPLSDPRPLPEFKIAGIFSDHAVLQRERPVTVWGFTRHAGDAVEGRWFYPGPPDAEDADDGRETSEIVRGAADGTGFFALTFRPRPASSVPTRMTFSSPHGSAALNDVLVGDVWIIGGQSNAELNLRPCLTDTPEIEACLSASDPVRLFSQTQRGAAEHTEFHHAPARDIIDPTWRWSLPTPEAARSFSAIGYYTARQLAEKTGVPVGAVMMCAGGACLRELMPESLALSLGYSTGANVPIAGYYNTLISPLLMPCGGLQMRGQIFFQGESEGIWPEMAASYDTDLAAFVSDERARFGQDFPFYNVQLSSYREEGERYFPHLRVVRNSQTRALSLIPGSHLAVSRDLGSLPEDPDFAHSPHKYALSRRVAAQILANEYGIGNREEADSPMPRSARCAFDRRSVLVVFSGCGEQNPLFAADPSSAVQAVLRSGFVPRAHALEGGRVTGFSAETADGSEVPLEAELVLPDTVRVLLPEGTGIGTFKPEIRYAMSGIAGLTEANLCGGGPEEGALPVPSFSLPILDPRKLVILTDIGDTIIDEGTEVREGDVVVSASCIPGAKETYLSLFREGFPVVMNADGLVRSFRNTMAQHALDRIFVGRAVSEAVGTEKPDGRMFRAALEAAGFSAGGSGFAPEVLRRAVMIGNNVDRDIAGANRMGIRSVLLTWSSRRPFDDEHSPADRHPTYRIKSPEELLPLALALEAELSAESGAQGGDGDA